LLAGHEDGEENEKLARCDDILILSKAFLAKKTNRINSPLADQFLLEVCAGSHIKLKRLLAAADVCLLTKLKRRLQM
jgi:hypothetical protein